MMRVNDTSFSEILDIAMDSAIRMQDYECVPLMHLDGLDLDRAWKAAHPSTINSYRFHVDRAWRQSVMEVVRINSLLSQI